MQAVHRAETLGPADRHLCLTSWEPGPPCPGAGPSLLIPWLGDKPAAWGRTTSTPCIHSQVSSRISVSRLWLALSFRALEGLHRISTQASPLAASTAGGDVWVSPDPCQTSVALLMTSRDPLKPKPPDLPRGPAQKKVRARGPLSFPESTTQLCESPSTLCRRTGTGLPAQPGRAHIHIYIHRYTDMQSRVPEAEPAAPDLPLGGTASYLNVLLRTQYEAPSFPNPEQTWQSFTLYS